MLIPGAGAGREAAHQSLSVGCRKDGEERFERYKEAWTLLWQPRKRE